MESCNDARNAILSSNSNSNLDPSHAITMHVDLSSLNSVESFTSKVESQFSRVDLLVLNAAVFPLSFSTAEETGVDLTFTVNHVAHALLTTNLLKHYKDTMAAKGGMKIAVVSSSHHYFSPTPPPVTREALASEPDNYGPSASYGFSKVAGIHFVQEITDTFKRKGMDNFYINAVHPGASCSFYDTAGLRFVHFVHLSIICAFEHLCICAFEHMCI